MSDESQMAGMGEIRSRVGYADDGCDWTAWLVWNMNQRRRLSERSFVLPPARPVVTKIKPVKRKVRKTRGKKSLSDF